MKNEINRQLFKEKTQTDSHSIRQVFDIEPQDLAIFHAKANKYLPQIHIILLRDVVNKGSYLHGKNLC